MSSSPPAAGQGECLALGVEAMEVKRKPEALGETREVNGQDQESCTVDFLPLLPGNDSVGEDENLPAQSSSSSDEAST